MFTCHVISDLFYEDIERFLDFDLNIPDVDVVFLNGNLGSGKRSMAYSIELCEKYPDKQFIYNPGFTEEYIGNLSKYTTEFRDGLLTRRNVWEGWPSNLHYSTDNMIITLRNGFTIDVLCKFGFPEIFKYTGDWKKTYLYKNVVAEVTEDINHPKFEKPKSTSNVGHGQMFIWAYPEWVNQQCKIDTDQVRKWENTQSHYKVLVTHINPFKDSRLTNIKYMPYQIHLNDMLWISADTKVNNVLYQGAHLHSNPGRGLEPRSSIINVEWVLLK